MTDNLTVVIPFYEGHAYIDQLLNCLPADLPVVIVDDQSDVPLTGITRPNTTVYRPDRKLYFTGAVNYAVDRTDTDVLILNQDVTLEGSEWLELIEDNRGQYALIGERIKGNHPAFPRGYVHGVYQFMRRDAINTVGSMDAGNYPLWGASALWQWQICRRGFASLPVERIPGLTHQRQGNFGSSIQKLLTQEPGLKNLLIRTPPLISVVVPAYNHGRYLRDAIHSLIGGPTSLGAHPGQTLQSFEVIVVDDASEDNTPAVMAELANDWQGIRCIRHAQNRGTPAANNTGIKAASGQYIVMMCADDMREPWSLNDLYQAIKRNPGKVIYDEPTTFTDGKRVALWPLANYDFDLLLEKNMMHMGIMFERKAWEAVDGYPEEMIHGREDWAFNVRLGAAGYCGLKLARSGYLYRRHNDNRTLINTDWEWRQSFIAQMHTLYPSLYRGEKPMVCCEPKVSRGAARSAAPAASPQVPNGNAPQGMVLVEYIGQNVGSTRWGGPGGAPSSRYYVFANSPRDKIKYVATQDLDWLFGLREGGKPMVRLFVPPEVEPVAAPAPVTAPEITIPAGTYELGAAVVEAILGSNPDPGALTVAQIKELTLTPAQWGALRQLELDGKSRRSVIEYARAQMHDAAAY